VAAGLLELGEIMMTASERRLDTSSRNVANTSTPGYKTQETFQGAVLAAGATAPSEHSNLNQGALTQTHRPLDLALSGPGFFAVRAGGQIYFTRDGQFSRDSEGRVVNAQGMALQTDALEDVVVASPAPAIASDGAVVENGAPVAHIGVFEPADSSDLTAIGGSYFTAPDGALAPMDNPLVRQGALESANVDTASEMIAMMSAMREAEAGARVVQTYDALIEQSILTFSKGASS
jgi:flagellar basal-body rod protein FlgG